MPAKNNPRKNSGRVRIRNQWWRLVYGRAPRAKVHGLCDYEDRTLYVTRRGVPQATAIHEALHAALPYLTEEEIIAGEEAVVNALCTLERLA